MNLGIGFPESTGKRATARSFSISFRWFYLALFVVFLVLLFQVIRIQLISGPYYRVLAEQNRIKTKVIHAPRGVIYDRNGIALTHNIAAYRKSLPNCDSRNPSCAQILPREEVLSSLAKGETIENLEIDSIRQYPYADGLAHVLGFISEVSREELDRQKLSTRGYLPGDKIGRGGIEQQYEELLRGKPGKELIETDAKGKELRVLGKVEAVAGGDITTTLDSKLSQVAAREMKDKTGAVVVSNPKTGEILVLISAPGFDPNLFTTGGDVEKVLFDEQNRPLFDRAISGTYPPGSTFKIVTAAAGLEKGAIDKKTIFEDVGVLRIGAFSFPNWYFIQYGKTEGQVDIVKALKRSNDIFFYKAAEATGLEDLRAMGLKFGLSDKLGIDLPNEAAGLFPSDAWKRETVGEQWYIGDTYHLGIGQGYLLTTPLQVNAWTAVVANGGTLYQPRLVKNTTNTTNTTNKPINQNFLKKETIDLIREGMREACDTGGTGWPLFKFKIKNAKIKIDERNFFLPEEATVSGQPNDWVSIPVACKTGTAEFGDPKDRTHAWFTVFAPIEDPQITVTVLVEAGGEGSNVAAPIAKKILEEWFTR
ncbi:hypothetical protein HYT17_03670 [Candidatus Microgenomates bacterium]|nr:hypothetical protein [Candidatus Microgenomates bacterium]